MVNIKSFGKTPTNESVIKIMESAVSPIAVLSMQRTNSWSLYFSFSLTKTFEFSRFPSVYEMSPAINSRGVVDRIIANACTF